MSSLVAAAPPGAGAGSAAEKRCDLCEGGRFQLIATRDRRGRALETVVCETCGLVAHAHVPSEEQLSQYYARAYRQDYHGEVSPSARRVVRAWNNGRRILRQLAPFLSGRERVFEVGAGIGCTVKAFELAGFAATGIDPGVGFRRFAQEVLHARVDAATLFDVPPEPAYDLVVLVHVIEHFRSPREAVAHIRRLLRPGGRLYVECPNLAAPFARRAKLFHFAHVHNFTPATLTMLAQTCGFHVERQFSHRRDPNLQMLLARADVPPRAIDPTGLAATMDGLRRAGSLAYHFRWRYLAARGRKLFGYVVEHLTARRRLRQIVRECDGAGRDNGRPR